MNNKIFWFVCGILAVVGVHFCTSEPIRSYEDSDSSTETEVVEIKKMDTEGPSTGTENLASRRSWRNNMKNKRMDQQEAAVEETGSQSQRNWWRIKKQQNTKDQVIVPNDQVSPETRPYHRLGRENRNKQRKVEQSDGEYVTLDSDSTSELVPITWRKNKKQNRRDQRDDVSSNVEVSADRRHHRSWKRNNKQQQQLEQSEKDSVPYAEEVQQHHRWRKNIIKSKSGVERDEQQDGDSPCGLSASTADDQDHQLKDSEAIEGVPVDTTNTDDEQGAVSVVEPCRPGHRNQHKRRHDQHNRLERNGRWRRNKQQLSITTEKPYELSTEHPQDFMMI